MKTMRVVGAVLGVFGRSSQKIEIPANLEGTVEAEIYTQINEISDKVAIAQRNVPIPIHHLAANYLELRASSSYTDFQVDEVRQALGKITEVLEKNNTCLAVLRKVLLTRDLADKALPQATEIVTRYNAIIAATKSQSLKPKDPNLGMGSRIALRNAMRDYIREKQAACLSQYAVASQEVAKAMSIAENISRGLGFIEELRKDDKISKERTDPILKEIIAGRIKTSAARKKVWPKPDKIEIETKPRSTFDPNAYGKHSYRTQYNPSRVEFLTKRKIKTADAKEISLSPNFAEITKFVTALEQRFDEAGVGPAHASEILQRFPQILHGTRVELDRYLDKIDSLYKLHDPTKVSGILPRHSSQIYQSAQTLEAYLASKQ